MLDVIEPVVTLDMSDSLLAPFMAEEIRFALFQIHPNKSPGPDGLPPLVFKSTGMSLVMILCPLLRSF